MAEKRALHGAAQMATVIRCFQKPALQVLRIVTDFPSRT